MPLQPAGALHFFPACIQIWQKAVVPSPSLHLRPFCWEGLEGKDSDQRAACLPVKIVRAVWAPPVKTTPSHSGHFRAWHLCIDPSQWWAPPHEHFLGSQIHNKYSDKCFASVSSFRDGWHHSSNCGSFCLTSTPAWRESHLFLTSTKQPQKRRGAASQHSLARHWKDRIYCRGQAFFKIKQDPVLITWWRKGWYILLFPVQILPSFQTRRL